MTFMNLSISIFAFSIVSDISTWRVVSYCFLIESLFYNKSKKLVTYVPRSLLLPCFWFVMLTGNIESNLFIRPPKIIDWLLEMLGLAKTSPPGVSSPALYCLSWIVVSACSLLSFKPWRIWVIAVSSITIVSTNFECCYLMAMSCLLYISSCSCGLTTGK